MDTTIGEPLPDCKFDAGFMIPVIDPMRCEAKGPCVPICPYDVLAIRIVPPEDKARLSFIGRVKLFVHGGKQAYVENPDACHGCGLCVQACPEKAIKLQKQVQSSAAVDIFNLDKRLGAG